MALLNRDWRYWAREGKQLPPDGKDWRSWLILGGRGAGKTRAGAEWVRAQALGLWPETGPRSERIAIIGPTFDEARLVMIEGKSGLLAIHEDDERPAYEPSKRLLTWPNGSIAQVFSADDPDGLRGPQFDAAWCDELAKWKHADAAWDMLAFALRLGTNPRVVITTTPRPGALLKRLLADAATAISRSRTADSHRCALLGLRPLAPCHLRAVRQGGGVDFNWIRRTRIDGDSWDIAEVPLGEEKESYRIEILDGSNVKRAVTVDTPHYLYPSPEILTDFGTDPGTFTVQIAQLSAAFGPGAKLQRTIHA